MNTNPFNPTSGFRYRPQRSLLDRLHIDGLLLVSLLVLMSLGLIVLYSAGDQNSDLIIRQGSRIIFGLGLMVLIAQIPPEALKRWALLFYLFCAMLLILVIGIGSESKGATRWLNIPGLPRFQPSELMKLALPMLLCAYLAKTGIPPNLKTLLTSILIITVPVGLIIQQPDLGTSLLIASSGIIVLLLAGLQLSIILTCIALSLPCAFALWTYVMHDYQKQRVLTFINPESDALGAGWNIIQSTTAIGSGGLFGKGWLNGTQSHLDFLPESSTDFVIAVLAEEFGLFGVIILLMIYLTIMARSYYISVQSHDTFSRLIAGSISYTFFVYIFVNIGMVSGLLPVVGVPLPLISYGGTSIVTLLCGFGLLMSIQTHKRSILTP